MLINRRRNQKLRNLFTYLYLHSNSGLIYKGLKVQLAMLGKNELIIMYFFIKHLVSNYKVPRIFSVERKSRSRINLYEYSTININLSTILQTRLLQYVMFRLLYRSYPFKEPLFKRSIFQFSLNFVKLPRNLRNIKLDPEDTGDLWNFKMNILGQYSYIEYFYILKFLNFVNLNTISDDIVFEHNYLNLHSRSKQLKKDSKIIF